MMRIVLMVHQASGTAMKVAKGYRSASWEIAFFMVLYYHFVEELCTGSANRDDTRPDLLRLVDETLELLEL